jgi:hypothetical protein
MTVYFWGDGLGKAIEDLFVVELGTHLVDFSDVVFGNEHVDVLLLLTLDFKGLQAGVEDQVLLVRIALLAAGHQHTLDLHHVTWQRPLYVGLCEHELEVTRDVALSQLVRRLLDLDFLGGDEVGMFGDEAELAPDAVLFALLGLALSHRSEVIVEDLHVVLIPTDIAGEGRH